MSLPQKKSLRLYLKEQGFRWTPEREEVLKEALALEGHFEADELAYRLRKKGSRVSKATVYRTLPLLVKAGFIREVIHGEKHLHYEHVHGESHHDHLICLVCGKIIEFEDQAMKEIEERICQQNRFRPEKVLVEIYGYCEKCK
ncbi:MAG: transcriptional repressor [bacterium]